jgi:SAM-dependent methyltransferase/ADP-heptose:LPS heptosyltransferase
MTWTIDAPQGSESRKCAWAIAPYTRGRGLDLGCGPQKTYRHFIGVDSGKDTELFGTPITPDVRLDDCADLSLFGDASMDFVFSSHLLEHLDDPVRVLMEWWRVIKPGGHLVLYLPHKDFYPNIGTPGANPDHLHDFLPDDIIEVMHEAVSDAPGWNLLVNENRNDHDEYSFLQVYRKPLAGETPHYGNLAARPQKTVCICRFGGFGDMLQAAGLFPMFKAQGYHVTVMTTPKGHSIIEHDPHVDAWMIQDENQVPNAALTEYWEYWSTRFDRFVNLSESIEGQLLAMPGRANHAWPVAVRARQMNRNYLEWTAELAQVEGIPAGLFFPTGEEAQAAHTLLGSDPGVFNLVFALSGSSVHKLYPHMDSLIAKVLLDLPQARFFLTGDLASQILETGWEAEPRVICLSGRQSIRETLTLAVHAHCVLGPETGVLNAVAFEDDVAKVILLSHSSEENLTKHWRNTQALCAPADPSIPPCGLRACHQLHYGSRYCPTHPETAAALCQQAIDPASVFRAIGAAYLAWKDAQ